MLSLRAPLLCRRKYGLILLVFYIASIKYKLLPLKNASCFQNISVAHLSVCLHSFYHLDPTVGTHQMWVLPTYSQDSVQVVVNWARWDKKRTRCEFYSNSNNQMEAIYIILRSIVSSYTLLNSILNSNIILNPVSICNTCILNRRR